ncbi:MAG: hypothetical protein KGL68_14160, partial [Burkholderiales bacterium]|nr:hypothetical protein [Burkholderiales bacterium]
MATPTPNPPVPAADPAVPAPRARPGRRAFWTGTVLALAVVAGLGWLAWHLTRGDPGGAGSPAGLRP